MKALRARSGFTLIELMVGTVITSFTMVAVAAAFIAVQNVYQTESRSKTAVESARTGLDFIERITRLTGYGVDPRFAIDLAAVPGGVAKDNYAGTSFVTDDLAVRLRDPSFLRRGTLSGGTLDISPGTFGVALPVGQPLVVSCAGGTLAAVVRVKTTAVVATTSTATVEDYGAPFTTTSDACLTQTGGQAPYVMLMLEYRLRVIDVGGQPWLVAFRNLADDVTTSTNYDPVAAGVENFQVAYVMNRPPATSDCCAAQAAPDGTGNSDWVLGDAPSDEALDATASAPLYSTPYDHTLRFNRHPANVRGIKFTLVTRSLREDKMKAWNPAAVGNWTPASTARDGFFRSFMTTQVRLPNLASRSAFVPVIRPATATTDLNAWGG